MKILLVTEYFYPQSSGGTELYAYNLAKALQKQGNEVDILSVTEAQEKQIVYKELAVHYIPCNHDLRTSVINSDKPADNLDQFIAAIKKLNPDIIHFHTLTTSIGAYHIETAKQSGFKVILTSHIAAHTCLRGDLMRLGKFVCDGKAENKKCLSCYLQYRGIPEPLNCTAAFGMLLTGFPRNLVGVVSRKKRELQKLKQSLDQLVVVSNWQREVFIRNGFDPQKTNLCRQAIEVNTTLTEIKKDYQKLVIGFIGRITEVKGLHILLSSLKYVPTNNLDLRIAAIKVETETDYYCQQKQQVESLPNSVWIENLPNEKIGVFLQELDILCVPSQSLETGPFVVYESLAHGIPVLGSDLGGIAELVYEGKNGWLFPHQNEKYLGSLIASFITKKSEGSILKLKDIEPVNRPIAKLAEEMLEIYAKL